MAFFAIVKKEGEEGPYTYKDMDTLIADFKADIAKIRRTKP